MSINPRTKQEKNRISISLYNLKMHVAVSNLPQFTVYLHFYIFTDRQFENINKKRQPAIFTDNYSSQSNNNFPSLNIYKSKNYKSNHSKRN